jgi:hypothetical protein
MRDAAVVAAACILAYGTVQHVHRQLEAELAAIEAETAAKKWEARRGSVAGFLKGLQGEVGE